MKPNKTYPLSIVGELLASTPPSEVVFMPDKLYFDGVDTSTTPRLAINEIYIRKDALLEWAQEYLDLKIYDTKREVMEELIDKLNSL